MPDVGLRSALGAAIAAAALVGCGGGSNAEGPLADALSEVSAAGDARLYVTWVDVATLREAGGLPEDSEAAISEERWRTPASIAAGEAMAGLIGADVGFDPLAADRTMTVGTPPDVATRYDGVDAEAVEAAFEEIGFERDGDFLALGGEGELVGELVQDLGSAAVGINRIAIEGDAISIGGYEDPVAAALDDSEPLIDEPGIPAAAECLGEDAFAATIVDPEGATSEEVALAAVSLRAPADDGAVPEVVCAIGAEGSSIDATAECMRTAFGGEGINPVTDRPFSADLGEVEVETGETDEVPWARATFRTPAEEPVGTAFQMLEDGSLALAFGGGDPAALLGGRVTPEQAEALEAQLGDCAGG